MKRTEPMDSVVRNLVAQWEYLRHLPDQAAAAIRSAALVPLSDDSADAASLAVEELWRPEPARLSRGAQTKRVIHEVLLHMILDGEFEANRTDSPSQRSESGWPMDQFTFRGTPRLAKAFGRGRDHDRGRAGARYARQDLAVGAVIVAFQDQLGIDSPVPFAVVEGIRPMLTKVFEWGGTGMPISPIYAVITHEGTALVVLIHPDVFADVARRLDEVVA